MAGEKQPVGQQQGGILGLASRVADDKEAYEQEAKARRQLVGAGSDKAIFWPVKID